MKNLCVKNYLETFAILLMIIVNEINAGLFDFLCKGKSDMTPINGSDNLSDITIQNIEDCKVQGIQKSNDKTDVNEILSNINYRDITNNLDSLYERNLRKITIANKVQKKCLIRECFLQLYKNKLDATLTIQNLLQKAHKETSDPNETYKDYDFAKRFYYYLQNQSSTNIHVMNNNAWCMCQACKHELLEAGFKYKDGDDNKVVLKSQEFLSKDASKFGILLKEYIEYLKFEKFITYMYILKVPAKKMNINQFCVRTACLHELQSIGYNISEDDKFNKTYKNEYENLISDFLFFTFINAYSLHLTTTITIDWKDNSPLVFCLSIGLQTVYV